MPRDYRDDIKINGVGFNLYREKVSARKETAEFIPLVTQEKPTGQLLPANFVTWNRGGGATRKVADGMYSYGLNVWTNDPGIVLPGPLVTQVAMPTGGYTYLEVPNQGMAAQDGHLYIVAGRYVIRIPNGSDAPVLEQDLGVGFVATSIMKFGTSLFVAGGTTGSIWEKPSGGAWTQAPLGTNPVYRGVMGTVFWTTGTSPSTVASERLVASDASTTSGIRYVAANPRNDANWTPATASTPIVVGDYPVTNMIATREHLYVATQDGLHDLDASGMAPSLTPEGASLVMATNGRAIAAAEGFIYIGVGYGLMRVRVISTFGRELGYALPEWCSPGLGLPNETPGSGIPYAMARKGPWLILAQWDPSANTSYISWGRQSLQQEPSQPMTWNMWPIVLSGVRVTSLFVSGLINAQPRLWITAIDANGVVGISWAYLPLDTPMQDLRFGRQYQFATNWQLDLSDEDWGEDLMPKMLTDVVIEADSLGGGNIYVEAATDGSQNFTGLGTINTNIRQDLQPSTPLQGGRVRLRLVGSSPPASPTIMRKVSMRAFGRSDTREIRHYEVTISRTADEADPVQTKAMLAGLQQGSVITLRDEAEVTYRAVLLAGIQFSEVDIDPQGHAQRTEIAQLSLALLSTPPGTPFYWGDGTKWGQVDRVFGTPNLAGIPGTTTNSTFFFGDGTTWGQANKVFGR